MTERERVEDRKTERWTSLWLFAFMQRWMVKKMERVPAAEKQSFKKSLFNGQSDYRTVVGSSWCGCGTGRAGSQYCWSGRNQGGTHHTWVHTLPSCTHKYLSWRRQTRRQNQSNRTPIIFHLKGDHLNQLSARPLFWLLWRRPHICLVYETHQITFFLSACVWTAALTDWLCPDCGGGVTLDFLQVLPFLHLPTAALLQV